MKDLKYENSCKRLVSLVQSWLFLSKYGFLFNVQGLGFWPWKTKISVWQFRSCVQFRCRWL